MSDVSYFKRAGRPALAYRYTPAENKTLPGVVFLGGYRSDMEGTKAVFLEEQCRGRGQAFLRFDYSAHGASAGDFKDQTLSLWLEDTFEICQALMTPPFILVGSSMGGWLALLYGRERPDEVAGIIGIAAAPDFTRDIKARLSPAQQRYLNEKGYIEEPNEYSPEPYIFTRALIEDGEALCLLDQQTAYSMPVRLLQGMRDTDVSWQKAYRMKNAVTQGGDVDVLLIEQGDHRLSRPEDLALIDTQVRLLSGLED